MAAIGSAVRKHTESSAARRSPAIAVTGTARPGKSRSVVPNRPAVSRTSGSTARGTPKRVERLVGPGETADVEQGGARGVGRVGRVAPPAGETPEEETVDGPEGQRAAALPGQRIEQPAQFGGGEVRVGDVPGDAADGASGSCSTQPGRG